MAAREQGHRSAMCKSSTGLSGTCVLGAAPREKMSAAVLMLAAALAPSAFASSGATYPSGGCTPENSHYISNFACSTSSTCIQTIPTHTTPMLPSLRRVVPLQQSWPRCEAGPCRACLASQHGAHAGMMSRAGKLGLCQQP